jgi:putative membrane protein
MLGKTRLAQHARQARELLVRSRAANEGEVQQGNVASTRATSADVRSFAQMMVTDHTNAMNTARDVFSRNGITAGENATSRSLRDTSQRTVTNLSTYSGAAFDRTYMQSQVDVHQWLLNSLDTALIPSAVVLALSPLAHAQSKPDPSGELQLVVALFRHGIRAPLPDFAEHAGEHSGKPWPDFNAWGVGKSGQLDRHWGYLTTDSRS